MNEEIYNVRMLELRKLKHFEGDLEVTGEMRGRDNDNV